MLPCRQNIQNFKLFDYSLTRPNKFGSMTEKKKDKIIQVQSNKPKKGQARPLKATIGHSRPN